MKKVYSLFLSFVLLFNLICAYAENTSGQVWEDETYGDEVAMYTPLPDYEGDWVNFRSNDENMGITYSYTPRNKGEMQFNWSKKYSQSYKDAFTPPIIVNDNLYIAGGNRVYILDKVTGEELCVSQPLKGELGYALNPITYGGGMVFVPISKGRIQALRADNLESLWVSSELGGQSISPVTYKDGYVFSGTWSGENKDGRYYCLEVSDEDASVNDEIKTPLWEITHPGGFYWAGAYAGDGYVVFGSDDGKKGYDNTGSVLYSVSVEDGNIIDTICDIKGDIRSSVSFDTTSSYVYFSAKCGDFHRVILNDDGSFDHTSHSYINVGNMTTSTPIIHNNLGFCGVCGEGQFAEEGHSYAVIDVSGEEMTLVHREKVPGYVQTSALLSVSYESDFDKIYLYLTYNREPGGIYVIEIKNPSSVMKVMGEDLYLPQGDMAGYCVCSLVCDNEGNIYYKNDSGYLFSIGKSDSYEYYPEISETEEKRMSAIEKAVQYLDSIDMDKYDEAACEMIFSVYDEVTDKVYETDAEDDFEMYVSEGITKIQTIIRKYEDEKNTPVENAADKQELFTDISDSPYKTSIEAMCRMGIVKGMNEKEFMPSNKVTRGEFVEFLYRMTDDKSHNNSVCFSDVKNDDWFYHSICWAYENDIVKGISENEFGPYEYVTNEQVAVFLSRYAGSMGCKFDEKDFNMRLYEYDDISSWAIGEVIYLTGYGIMPVNNGCISPKDMALREEVCNILYNIIKYFQWENRSE